MLPGPNLHQLLLEHSSIPGVFSLLASPQFKLTNPLPTLNSAKCNNLQRLEERTIQERPDKFGTQLTGRYYHSTTQYLEAVVDGFSCLLRVFGQTLLMAVQPILQVCWVTCLHKELQHYRLQNKEAAALEGLVWKNWYTNCFGGNFQHYTRVSYIFFTWPYR